MTAALLLALLAAPDTLLVDVQLDDVGAVVVEAILDADSTLHLPTRELAELFKTEVASASTITLDALGHAFRLLVVNWQPRELRVLIADPYAVLPATRRHRAAAQRQAFGGPQARLVQSGPFVAFAADEQHRHLVDVGYSWRGLVAVAARQSSVTGTTWHLSVAPSPRLFLSASGAHLGVYERPALTAGSARLAVGPAWAQATWSPSRWDADALASVGPVSVFLSSRRIGFVTIRGHGIDLQAGQNAGVSAFRVSVGPFSPSPFVFPQTF